MSPPPVNFPGVNTWQACWRNTEYNTTQAAVKLYYRASSELSRWKKLSPIYAATEMIIARRTVAGDVNQVLLILAELWAMDIATLSGILSSMRLWG